MTFNFRANFAAIIAGIMTTLVLFGCNPITQESLKSARLDLQNGHLKSAYERAKYVAKIERGNGEAYFIKGVAEFGLERYNNSVSDFTRAIKLGFNKPLSYFYRGTIRHLQGLLWEARRDYQFALNSGCERPELFVNFSDTEYRLGYIERALSYSEKALQLAPDSPEALGNRAAILFRVGQNQGALQCVEKAIGKSSGKLDTYLAFDSFRDHSLLRKEILEKQGRNIEALQEKEAVWKLIKKYNKAYTKVSRRNELLALQKNKLSTGKLEIASDFPMASLKEYGTEGERFLSYIDKEYCPLDGYKSAILVLPTRSAFRNLYKKEIGKSTKWSGCYLSAYNVCMINGKRDYSLLRHELTHSIMREKFLIVEKWAAEGLPELFEHSYLEIKNQPKLILELSYVQIREDLEDKKTNTDLVGILSCFYKYSHQRFAGHLVATFLAEEDKLVEYFKLAQTGKRNGYPTVFEAAFNKPIAEIGPLWEKYIERLEKE